ncbi:MAG: DUF4157 domain-containing protein, partial [Deltaproteobacteria bacterium]
MSHDFKRSGSTSSTAIGGSASVAAPGKRTLTEGAYGDAVQRKASPVEMVQRRGAGPATEQVHAAAARGIEAPATTLPFAAQIQASFGPRHDVSSIRAHVGGGAAEATAAMGASAYATGNEVVFGGAPDLHTAAHEAAHVVQQAHGVSLYGGVGQAGDGYERHADAVADRVVAGQSAADLLDGFAGKGGGAAAGVQRRSLTGDLLALFGAPARASTAAPVQMALSDTLRSSLEIYGPVNYNAIIEMIHAAPAAERQAAMNDATLRDLINTRLTAEWAQTVFSSLMEGSQKWKNPTGNDFFDFFVTRNGDGPLPNTATMNCWESILYAAFLARQVSASWIRTFYNTALGASDPNQMIWQQLGFSTSLPTYAAPSTSGTGGGVGAGSGTTRTPSVGQLLFYHTGGAVPGHVAVSLGGDQAISLWNQPNNVDAVQRIRVTDLAGTVY